MEWTKEKPKEPGYYWARDTTRLHVPPIVCRVRQQSDGKMVVSYENADYSIEEIDCTEWQGPIEPPA